MELSSLLNLTPHEVRLRRGDGSEVVLPPSGTVARVSTTEEVVETFDGIPLVRRVFGEPVGLPPEGVPCIVSALVAAAVPGRKGVFAPDTGPTAVRDEKGLIVAVTRLIAA